MALQFDTTTRSNMLTQLNTAIGVNALLDIFTGSPPANCAAASTGTLLGTFTCNATNFGTVSAGVLTVAAIANITAGATGTAGYFRVRDSGGVTVHMQGTVALSAADLNITNTSINSGDTLSVSSWTITAPGA